MITKEHARRLRRLIEQTSAFLDDTDALNGVELFPHWSDSKEYEAGERVNYNGTLFKCLTAHTSQPSWTPDVSPSLWVRVDDPSIEWPEWIQPTGATDAYPLGAKVSHNSKHWISDVDNNVWEPGIAAFVSWLMKPIKKLEDHETRIKTLEETADERKRTDQFMMKSMNAIINHMIDHNSIDKLKEVRDEYQSEIIKHHQ